MYELLNRPNYQRAGGLAIPQFRRIKDGLELNLRKIQAHYRDNLKYLKSDHFLFKLINGLNISLQYDDHRFVGKVDDWSMDLAMALKMTSATYRGRLFTPGHFYGRNVDEAIVANTDAFDIDEAVKHWADLQPIRVLAHPFCDFDMALPNGHTHSEGSGIAVITVNIPMLALQYKCWRRWERSVNADSPQSITQFIHAFPIPNMLESHVNIAILNRIMTMFFSGTMPKGRSAHSFYLTNWASEVDQVARYYLDHVYLKDLTFNGLIGLMPTIGGQTMHTTLKLPNEAFTIQLQWAVVLARLTLTAFLVQMNSDAGNTNNQSSLNYLLRYLTMLETNRALSTTLPRQHLEHTWFVLNNGIRPYL